MDRLHSEIEFRNDDHRKIQIEKPFDEGDPDVTESYARYDARYDAKYGSGTGSGTNQYVSKKKRMKDQGQLKQNKKQNLKQREYF